MSSSYFSDLTEYSTDQWSPLYVLLDLIQCKFIDLNTLTGEVYQLRNFLGGLPVERTRIYPVLRSNRNKRSKKERYLYLEVEVRSSRTTRRRVGVKLHKLVYILVHGRIPPDHEIHHKNGDIYNNGINNLVALLPDEHRKVGKETGVHEHPNNIPTISKDDPVVQKIKELHASDFSLREIAKQVGYSHVTCHKIVTGKYRFR